MRLRFGAVPETERGGSEQPSLLREARDGLIATAGLRGVRWEQWAQDAEV